MTKAQAKLNTTEATPSLDTPSSQCDFCQIPFSKTTSYFTDFYGDLPHTLQVPGVPSNFTVLQDLVPVAEFGGHLLLMPNKHVISLATVANQEDIRIARDAIVKQLQLHFPNNPLFMFEHGPGFIEGQPIACGGCHLDHAHGHIIILPAGTTLNPIQNKMEEMLVLNGWDNLSENRIATDELFTNISKHTKLNPYLQIGITYPNHKTESFIYIQNTTTFNVASQLLRTVISDVVFRKPMASDWHWRDIHSGFASPARKKELLAKMVKFREITSF